MNNPHHLPIALGELRGAIGCRTCKTYRAEQARARASKNPDRIERTKTEFREHIKATHVEWAEETPA